MFERFTEEARLVVVYAQDSARELNHAYIGTEHLLLGLLRQVDGLAAKALGDLGWTVDAALEELGRRIPLGESTPQGHIPFTPRAKKVLEFSLREALRMGDSFIGSEHVLLGILQEGEGVAAQILMSREHTLDRVRRRLMEAIEEAGPERKTRAKAGRIASMLSGHGLITGPDVPARLDELVKRLEAIEARLSAIERTLRERGDQAAS